jgi:hypothetical protein
MNAAEEFEALKLDNPNRATSYKEVTSRLTKLFHSIETRSHRGVKLIGLN